MTADDITTPIKQEMAAYEALFCQCLQHKDGMLSIALQHLAGRRGKMMRPRLMLLCARAHGSVTQAVLHAAVAVELLHTASLVHDDIVDESRERRGAKSINALLDNKAAVLVGDYLLSTALSQAAATADIRVNERLAWLGQTLAEGELMQMDCTLSHEVSENDYREVIRRKTASLFAVCAELGALLSGASPQSAAEAFAMGEAIGMAFQMRDDVFDYYSTSVGKPTCGADLMEGKVTLPLIHAVQQDPTLLPLVLKARALEATEEERAALLEAARNKGMDYTHHCMQREADTARSIAATYPPDIREALEAYIALVAERLN